MCNHENAKKTGLNPGFLLVANVELLHRVRTVDVNIF